MARKKEAPVARKYKFKNLSKGLVHIKEMRRALSAGKEREWEGVLGPNTPRLQEQGLLSIEDLGPSDKIVKADPFARTAAAKAKEKAMGAEVTKKLAKLQKNDKPSGGKVEAVKASDVGVTTSATPTEETPAVKVPEVKLPVDEPKSEEKPKKKSKKG